MHEQMTRDLDLGRHQHRRPDHAVELEDVLADQMEVRRPVARGQVLALARIGERGDVVEQRVEPHIEDLALVPRRLHSPAQPRACARDVLEPLPDEAHGLVEALARQHEVRPLLVVGKPEEVVVLLLPGQHDLVDRALVAVEDLQLGLEVGTARAVPALVGAGIDLATVVEALHELLDGGAVLGVRRADEEVVRGVHPLDHLLEVHDVAIRELARGDALALGDVRDRLAVLVGAGQEEHVLAPLAHVAREDVGGDRRVRVAQVGLRVDVVDRRGDVEAHGGGDYRAAHLTGASSARRRKQLASIDCVTPSPHPCSRPGDARLRGRDGGRARRDRPVSLPAHGFRAGRRGRSRPALTRRRCERPHSGGRLGPGAVRA